MTIELCYLIQVRNYVPIEVLSLIVLHLNLALLCKRFTTIFHFILKNYFVFQQCTLYSKMVANLIVLIINRRCLVSRQKTSVVE